MLACAQINSRVGPISGRRRHRRASPSSSRAHRRLADVVSPLSTRPRRRRAAPSSSSSSRHRRAPGAIVSPSSTRPIVVVSPTLSSRSRHRLTDVVSSSSKRALQPSSRVSTRRRLAVDTKPLTCLLRHPEYREAIHSPSRIRRCRYASTPVLAVRLRARRALAAT